jgi:hypothetical protein
MHFQGVEIFENLRLSPVFSNEAREILKFIFSSNYRIAVSLKQIKSSEKPETVIYHFQKDSRSDFFEMNIICVQSQSVLGDPLKLCGVTKNIKDVEILFKNTKFSSNNQDYFERYKVEVYPSDWYECFETIESAKRLAILDLEIKNIISNVCSRNVVEKDSDKSHLLEQNFNVIKGLEEKKKMEELSKFLESKRNENKMDLSDSDD